MLLEAIHAYLLPDGRDIGTWVPADGHIFVTSYRIIFLGSPWDPDGMLLCVYMYMHVHMSISPTIIHHPSIHLSIDSFMYAFIHLSIHLSIHPPINPSIHLSIHPSIDSFIDLFIHTYIHSNVYLSIYLFLYLSIHSVDPNILVTRSMPVSSIYRMKELTQIPTSPTVDYVTTRGLQIRSTTSEVRNIWREIVSPWQVYLWASQWNQPPWNKDTLYSMCNFKCSKLCFIQLWNEDTPVFYGQLKMSQTMLYSTLKWGHPIIIIISSLCVCILYITKPPRLTWQCYYVYYIHGTMYHHCICNYTEFRPRSLPDWHDFIDYVYAGTMYHCICNYTEFRPKGWRGLKGC